MSLKRRIARLLGERNLGRLDYVLKPGLRAGWGGPFNGQKLRRRIFLELLKRARCPAIVETGTYLGTTTAFLATLGLPVYTAESNPRFHAYASWRLLRSKGRIHLYEADSREFLRSLSCDPTFPKERVLFYLDAHWYAHLPLREELEFIFTQWPDSIAMVDDFQVPGTAYGYDDYGSGQVLNLEYLEPLRYLQLIPFFPAVGPQGETGAKRGCVVLCRAGGEINRLISEIETLRPAHNTRMSWRPSIS
jgi:hypothetical protein